MGIKARLAFEQVFKGDYDASKVGLGVVLSQMGRLVTTATSWVGPSLTTPYKLSSFMMWSRHLGFGVTIFYIGVHIIF